ncbi:MAG: hypothetical protein QXQ47_02275 [Candidatus Bathyarchaeia archaeon]
MSKAVVKPGCFGDFLRYPALVCLACRFWRECLRGVKVGGEA